MNEHIYNPSVIEAKWQLWWDEHSTFCISNDINILKTKPKAYVLDMFPYPSGEGLHVGHPKSYTASDVLARLRRMQGYNVLHAMGWDAFGLPAERAAEREKTHPAIITRRNIDNFRRQLKRMGFSYDWAREVNTSSPDYYKWTQWIFLKLYDQGLAYMADVPVNWCPALGTVLSNEEVYEGRYVETGDLVERRQMRQWMLKITAYAERLLADLDELDWPESLKEMQRNWIGKSYGANVAFSIKDTELTLNIFTTRPDTLFGATYCVLAPEHPYVEQISTAKQKTAVTQYKNRTQNQSDMQRTALNKDKTGVFTGAYAINPVNNQHIPIWISDYVLMSYGTGAIMAVPAHDQRDYEFAKLFGLDMIEVVRGNESSIEAGAYEASGICINSSFLNGLNTDDAKQKITEWLEETKNGRGSIQYRLRDWLFSRQRYWGEPFPIIHLDNGTLLTVSDDQLPIELPELVSDTPTVDGQPPLARASDQWITVALPDGRNGLRETNTMPQWAGSCWYYLRYIDPLNNEKAWDPALEHYWMPVDIYIGGVEHAVLHLLYARFWHKVLYDCGLVSTKEPFARLFNQGMTLATSYRDANGKYYYANQVEEKEATKWFVKDSGKPVQTQLEKMSKSRLNVYGLDDVINQYGADSLRLYELFIGPLSASGPWQMAGIEGMSRFLERVWRLVVDETTGNLNRKLTEEAGESTPELWRLLHKTIKGVTQSIESIDKLNTTISRLMIFSNAASQSDNIPKQIINAFLRILSPLAPHICEELWQRLGESTSIADADWPQYNDELCRDEKISIAVQINGKLRTVIEIDADALHEDMQQAVLTNEKVLEIIGEKSIERIIIVPRQLVNVLLSEA